jgi:plastocyanin
VGKRVFLALIAGVTLTVLVAACGNDNDDEAVIEGTVPATAPAGGGTDAAYPAAAPPAAPTAAAATPAAATASPSAAATAAPAPAGPQALNVRAGEYFFDPKEYRVLPGAVVVSMHNEGPDRRHVFAVRNLNGSGDLVRSEQSDVGSTITVQFTIEQEGTYQVYCTLPGHADRGQTASLIVARS